MMQGFRKAGQTWLGRAVIAVLFGFLILSFAIWGIGDMIRNVGSQSVAKVGSTEIGVIAFREAYQNELQGISRRIRRAISSDEARALGLDRRILDKMISDAALDDRVRQFGLAISDETIAQAILDDPNFKGPDGRFNRFAFDEILRNAGYSEQSFVKAQRNVYLRGQIAEGLAGAPGVPLSMLEAVNRFRAERRSVDYFILNAAAAGEIVAPAEAEIATFFERRKSEFRAPEYRKVSVLMLSPSQIADPAKVPESELRTAYDRLVPIRFTNPERRAVKQMVISDAEKAQAASDALAAGRAFDDVASEAGLKPSDTDLGLVQRREIADAAVAEAAFKASPGIAAGPIESRFGKVFVLVTAVEPEKVASFEEASPILAAEIARSRAADKVRDLHDAIEDQRASAKTLIDIAKENGLPLVTVELDRTGRGKDGGIVIVPEATSVVPALFASDVGVDNEAIATREGGWLWFSVDGIEVARDRPLADVRTAVENAWRSERLADLLAAKAAEAVKRIEGGEAIEKVAGEFGATAVSAEGLARSARTEGISPAALSQIFLTPVDKAASALGAAPDERMVFRVTKAEVSPLPADAAVALGRDLELALGDDIVNAYITETKRELGVSINAAGLRLALGSGAE
jgi:peptidyl-prolyl cis-trans isomerase D